MPLIIFVKNRTIAQIKKMAATITAIATVTPLFGELVIEVAIISDTQPTAINTHVKIWLNNAFREYVEAGGFATIQAKSGNNTGAKNTLR